MIDLRDLSFTYRNAPAPALRQVSLKLERGERLLVLGASGSGKSTLARCINGLIPHAYPGQLEGQVAVAGEQVANLSLKELALRVGTVLQDPEAQFVGLTVAEDVAFGLENLSTPRAEMAERVQEALEWVEMWHLRAQPPHALSGGQKQRVAIAGILAMGPELLLLDEPLAHLDPESARHLLEVLRRLGAERNKSMVIIEHRLEEALEAGIDRIALLHGGELVAWDEPGAVISSGRLEEAGIRLPSHTELFRQLRLRGRWQGAALPVSAAAAAHELQQLTARWTLAEVPPVPGLGPAPRPDEVPIVQCQGLTFAYEPHLPPAVAGVDLTIRPGERVALLGHNGAGKSTLALLLLGLLQPTAGSVAVGGKPAAGRPVSDLCREIGLVMQNPNHMLSLPTVAEELAFGPHNLGLAPSEAAAAAERSLAVCDLEAKRRWPPFALSHGQKKRVTVASVLAMGSRLLLLDEPTAGQDDRHYRAFMDFISSLCDQGYAVLAVTHDLNLALRYTPRAIVMANGRILADGPTAGVLRNPALMQEAGLRPPSLARIAGELGLPMPGDPEAAADWLIREVTGDA